MQILFLLYTRKLESDIKLHKTCEDKTLLCFHVHVTTMVFLYQMLFKGHLMTFLVCVFYSAVRQQRENHVTPQKSNCYLIFFYQSAALIRQVSKKNM